jgi:hypothetical protein
MKLIALAFSAVVGLAAAQLELLADVPQCALECFTSTVMKTDCALTDFYCQCGKEAEFITKTTLECLCTSTCTTSDLTSTFSLSHPSIDSFTTTLLTNRTEVLSITNQLCTKALADKGETYKTPDASMANGICHPSDAPTEDAASSSTMEASSSSTAAAVAPMSTGSSNSTGSAMPTSANGTTSSSPKATGADFEGAAASSFGMSIAAIAIGGVAFLI